MASKKSGGVALVGQPYAAGRRASGYAPRKLGNSLGAARGPATAPTVTAASNVARLSLSLEPMMRTAWQALTSPRR